MEKYRPDEKQELKHFIEWFIIKRKDMKDSDAIYYCRANWKGAYNIYPVSWITVNDAPYRCTFRSGNKYFAVDFAYPDTAVERITPVD